MKPTFIRSITTVATLCITIFAVSTFFVYNERLIGFVLIFLFLVCLGGLIPFHIQIREVQPDIMFGIIDNGILALLAIIGGEVAGVTGAIIGGVVGNAITDGIAGLFEGSIAENLRKKNISEQRTILGSAVGKMAGCLLGAGYVLILASMW